MVEIVCKVWTPHESERWESLDKNLLLCVPSFCQIFAKCKKKIMEYLKALVLLTHLYTDRYPGECFLYAFFATQWLSSTPVKTLQNCLLFSFFLIGSLEN